MIRRSTEDTDRSDGREPRVHRRLRDDAGQVAGIEVLPFGFLMFVIGMLLIANAWGVVDANLATTTAAREGVRAYVESPSAIEAQDRAVEAAAAALVGYGRSPFSSRVDVETIGGRGWQRCTLAVVTVHHEVPLLTLPVIGGFGHAFDVVSRQSEVVDPYRDGVEGEARC
ncbi:MAG: hypothetical protein EBX39_01550 [Actinobacteria bacterium]|nr:hypothetical protein [Actinomycetota bacterium]